MAAEGSHHVDVSLCGKSGQQPPEVEEMDRLAGKKISLRFQYVGMRIGTF